MEDNKSVDPEVETNDKIDHLKPIKDVIGKAGIKMPDLVATGDLTVESKDEVVVVGSDTTKEVKETNKKDIPLPEIGSKFMLNGHEYKVIYINDGQHRFSCEPCKGIY